MCYRTSPCSTSVQPKYVATSNPCQNPPHVVSVCLEIAWIMSRMRFLLHLSSALMGSTHVRKACAFATPVVSWESRKRSLRACLLSSSSSSSVEDQTCPTNHSVLHDDGRPFFRIYYNDVYEVELPPRHRFPMKKYAQVRKQIQQWISDLPEEEQRRVNCGTYRCDGYIGKENHLIVGAHRTT